MSELVQPWQRGDFLASDPGWMDLATRSREFHRDDVVRRFYIERPRGHSKTSDMAVQLAWILSVACWPVSGLAAAADLEQAKLIHRAVQRLAVANPDLLGDLRFIDQQVRHVRTGSRLDIISSDVAGSWGALPDFVVCDELCHWRKPELWESLVSSAAKQPHALLTVLTNAGHGHGWHWHVREHARKSGDWYFSTLDGPQAPWITSRWLEDQRALLPRPVFDRLWMNRWQHAAGEYISLEEARACRDPQLSRQGEGRRGVHYVATIDYAEKRDLTVGCVCHRETDRIVVDRMDVVRPRPDRPTPVRWVEEWIHEIARSFGSVQFVVDSWQLLHTIQQLGQQYHIERFDFRSGAGNEQIAQLLRELVTQRKVRWYPGCGFTEDRRQATGSTRVAGSDPEDDLEMELASLVVRETRSGRYRFDHLSDGEHHDDRSFALGVACLTLTAAAPEPVHFAVTPPQLDGGFAWFG